MMSTGQMDIIEGTWEEVSRQAVKFNGHRLRVVILADESVPARQTMIIKGMFPQLADINEDDFKSAEYHFNPDKGSEEGA